MSHIIEYLGSEGVITSELTVWRWQDPHPGDAVLFEREGQEYFGMIEGQDVGLTQPGEYHICVHAQGAFLGLTEKRKPYLDISGGPFQSVPLGRLQPTFRLHTQRFWNWGDHSPGAGH